MSEQNVEYVIRGRNLTAAAFAQVQEALDAIDGKAKKTSGGFGSMASMAQTAIGTMGGFIGAQAVIGGLKSAFSFAMNAAIGMNASLEKSTLQFGTLMGDSKRAEQHVRDLFEFAKQTPFETKPIIDASRHMQTFGGDALNTMKNLTLLGDASAATGAPIDQLGFWVGRMFAALKGGQPIGEAAARLMEMGVIAPQTRQQMESLAKSAGGGQKAFDLFKDSLGGFQGAMVAQASTWDGLMSSISDSINITLADALRPFFETVKMGAGMVMQVLGSSGVGQAFTALKNSLGVSIGGDSAGMLKQFISSVLTLGDAFLATAGIAERIFNFALNGIRVAVYALITTFFQMTHSVMAGFAAVAEGAAKLPGVGDKFKGVSQDLRRLSDEAASSEYNFRLLMKESASAAIGQSTLSKAIDGSRGVLKAVRDEVDKYQPAIAAATVAKEKHAKAISDVSKEHTDAIGKIRALASELTMAEKAKFTIKETTEKFGSAIKGAVLEAKLFGIELPDSIAKAAKGIKDAELAAKMAKELKELNANADKAGAEFQKEMYEMAVKGGEQFKTLTGVVDKVQTEIAGMNKKGLEKQLFDLNLKMKDEITALGGVPKGYEHEYGKAVEAVKTKYALMASEAKKNETDIVEIMKGQGVKTRAEMEKDLAKATDTYDKMKASGQFTAGQLEAQWKHLVASKEALHGNSAKSFDTLLGSMVDGFAKLAQIAGGSLANVAKDIGSVFAAMKLGGDAAKGLSDAWKTAGASMQDKMGAVAIAAPAMASSMIQATSSASTAMNAVGGAAAGAKMGMAFGGPYGAAVGAAVGLVIGLIRRTEHVEIMKDVGRQWGQAISDGLAKQIEADAKKWFNKDRVAGSIFNLDKVIQEAGGLTSKNYDTFIGKLHDVFSMIEIGRFSVAQGRDVLDKNFGFFAAQIDKSSGLAGAKLFEIMDLNDRFGTNSKAVADFVNNESKRALSGIATFAQNAQVTTQASADAMGTAVGGLFAKMVASGVPLQTALKEFEPTISALSAQFSKAGLDGGAAFTGITSMVDFMKDKVSGPAVTAVLGLNDAFVGLHNTRLLTQEGFSGLAGQVTATFNELVNQGKNGNQALAGMQPTLQTIWRLQKDFGYAVDEGTQHLIDQGVEAGIVGDKHRDAQDRTATAMERVGSILELIARKWGVDLPNSIGTFAGAATKAFDDAGGAGESFIDRTRGAIDGLVADGIPILKGGFDTIGRVLDTDIPDAAVAGFSATAKLAGSLVASVNKTLEGITREIEVDIDANVTRNDEGGGGGSDDPGFSTGGVIDAGAGRRIIAHGRELIMPLDRPSPIGTQFVRELIALTPSSAPAQSERFDRLEHTVSTLAAMMTTMPGDMARAYRDGQLQLGARG